MYQVEAATWSALQSSRPKVEPVAKWYYGTGSSDAMDITDRLVGGVPPVDSRIGAYLDGFESSPLSLTVDNSDRELSRATSPSALENTPFESLYLSKVETWARVFRADGTTEDVPTAAGLVRGVSLHDGVADIRADGYSSVLLDTPIPEELSVDHTWVAYDDHRSIELCKDLIDDYSPMASADIIDADDAAYVAHDLWTMDWPLSGRIPLGSTVGDIMAAMGRSSVFQFFVRADGSLGIETELPHDTDAFPVHFDESNAWGWVYDDGLDDFASEIIVRYRNGSEGWYRGSALESSVGRRTEVIECPFVAHYWQARWLARIMYEAYGGITPVIRFTTGPRALTLEVNDRIEVTPPDTGTRETARVTYRSWDGANVSVEATVLGHESTIINATFRDWDDSGTGQFL